MRGRTGSHDSRSMHEHVREREREREHERERGRRPQDMARMSG